jgi:hypothetical protein
VTFYERIDKRLRRLGVRTTPTGEPTVMEDAVAWRCERLVRKFVAMTVAPDGFPAGPRLHRTSARTARPDRRIGDVDVPG